MWFTPGKASGRKNIAPKLFMMATVSCVRSRMTYVNETMPLLADVEIDREETERNGEIML